MDKLHGFNALVALRMLCGVWFFPHCIGKLRDIKAAASGAFEKAGFKPARFFVVLTVILEITAGTGLVFGIYPRVAAALAVVVLAGSSYAVLKIHGLNWRWQKHGPELMVFWALACILSVLP